MKAAYAKYSLHFIKPGGTSRGVLTQKDTYFLKIWDEETPGVFGIGECALFKGLSAEDDDTYEEKLKELPDIVAGIIYLILGLALIIFSKPITPIIPYIFGALLILSGILRAIKYFTYKMYRTTNSTNLILAGILLSIGIIFICYPERGLELFALFWGIHAIVSGIQCFHRLFYYASYKQRWLVYLGEGLIEFVLGIMLFIEFSEGIATHLIILGVYFILVGFFGLFGIKIEKHGEKPIVAQSAENEASPEQHDLATTLSKFDDITDFIPDKEDFESLIPKEKSAKNKIAKKSAKNTQKIDNDSPKNTEKAPEPEQTENTEPETLKNK